MDAKERTRRYRARQRGEIIPKFSPGPKKGYKQSREHIDKRKRFGPEHHHWKGEAVSRTSGRNRAERHFISQPCELCGNTKAERHHKDNNTANNEPDNIQFLCRKCHMQEDGRLDDFKRIAKANQPKAVAARWS